MTARCKQDGKYHVRPALSNMAIASPEQRLLSPNAHSRDIVSGSGNGGNQEHDTRSATNSRLDHNSVARRVKHEAGKPAVVVADADLARMKDETKIFTAANLEDLEAEREAELERQRLSAKARKEHMMKLSEDAARRAPKSAIEQIAEVEKRETLRRASALKDQCHDTVKLMKTLGARAQAFTIRDQQLKVKESIDEERHVYDEKLNVLMEVERLEGLKRQEDVDERKQQKRFADRKVLEEQIAERQRQRMRESEQTAQEAREMLAKLQQQQDEAAERERVKAERAHKTMDEIRAFNDDTQARKGELARQAKDEEERILAYQRKKADDTKRREDDEAQRRYDAEVRTAKLRSMQEKVANEKAEMDELRAKRAAEARERQAREADLALAKKHRAEMDELRQAREAQALHRQRARIKEATLQKHEYESILTQVEAEKARVKQSVDAKHVASMGHRRVLQEQIEEKERGRKGAFARTQEEGQALKREFADELDKLERIRLDEVGDLVTAGVNPLYLSEMKALDIERIRNR